MLSRSVILLGFTLAGRNASRTLKDSKMPPVSNSAITKYFHWRLVCFLIVKSFPTREEADAYVAGREAPSISTQPSSQVEKFYGVARGRVPGVYTDWATAQEQIVGWKGPKYKKFATKAEAEEFVRSGSGSSAMVDTIAQDDIPIAHDAKRARTALTSHEGPARLGDDQKAELEIDYLDPVDPTDATKNNQKDVLRIYTDGSSLSNGQHSARAGLGVYFGPGDQR
jgi:ribonuclease HI